MLFTSCFSRFDSNGSGTCVNTTLLPGSKIHKPLEFMLMFFQDHFQGHHHPNNAQPTILSKHCSANALQFILSRIIIFLPDFYSVLSKSWPYITQQRRHFQPNQRSVAKKSRVAKFEDDSVVITNFYRAIILTFQFAIWQKQQFATSIQFLNEMEVADVLFLKRDR